MDLPTRLDLFAIGRDYIRQRATKIDPVQVDIIGSDANLFVGSTSFIGREIVNQILFQVTNLLLDGAERENLDRYAWDRYQLVRKAASPAFTEVTFYRDSVAAGAGTIPVGTRLATRTGIEYIVLVAASFGASTAEVTVPGRSVQAGSSQQAGANSIRRIMDPVFDSTMRVYNAEASAHAEDGELDELFRERIRDFWLASSKGVLGAIAYGARKVAGVTSAFAIEALTPEPRPARVVNLYIADSSGIAFSAIVSSVHAELMDWRAGGITVIVHTSSVQTVPVILNLQFMAGVPTAPVVDRIRAVFVESINKLGANQTLFRSQLGSILEMFKTSGLIPSNNSIVEPAGDVIPALGKTLRTTITDIQVM